MSLLRHVENCGDHRTEALLRVINLKTWETKMHIALTASHDLGSRAFRFHAVRLIGIELFDGSHWPSLACDGRVRACLEADPESERGPESQPLTYPLGICLWGDIGGRLPLWPILVGVDMSVPYHLVPNLVRRSPLTFSTDGSSLLSWASTA